MKASKLCFKIRSYTYVVPSSDVVKLRSSLKQSVGDFYSTVLQNRSFYRAEELPESANPFKDGDQCLSERDLPFKKSNFTSCVAYLILDTLRFGDTTCNAVGCIIGKLNIVA